MSIDLLRSTEKDLDNRHASATIDREATRESVDSFDATAAKTIHPTELKELPPVYAGGNRSRWYLVTRRVFDVVGALVALVLFAPVMIPVYCVLLVSTRGNPIFRQERIGFCGRAFTMFKFRTMSLDAESKRHLVKNERSGPVFKNRADPRITPFGRMLRSFSIDEMPQLLNVLRGEMSLVGPRPPIRSEVVQYTREQFERLSVNPGLTCLWQVSGRAELDFEQQVALDVTYVRNQNLWSDLQLIIRTPMSVLGRRGAY